MFGNFSLPGHLARPMRNRWLVLVIAFFIVAANQVAALAVVGNIAPLAIEIDSPSANLYPGGSTVSCSGIGDTLPTGTDWVADCATNSDTASLVDSIAVGLIPGTTSRIGGFGHWRGVRIVDGANGDDQDIFLKGGKENDTSTWTVGPGTVGSSKYDATQAYLANNQTDIFFGMERRGNNGTTAFDFEFNQNGAAGGYIPTRTTGDKLITFVMQGSGSSGTAEAFFFNWNGSAYVPIAQPAGVETSINNNDTTPAEPWGHVDSHGNWTDGNLQRFEFAEAKVPLSVLPGVSSCGGRSFVQVRTRSSATENSDLKDTTKIFEFLFNLPSASISKQSQSGSALSVTLNSSVSGVTSPVYQWQARATGAASFANISGATSSTLTFTDFEGVDGGPDVLSSISVGSPASVAGTYSGKLYKVDIRLHVSDGSAGCFADSNVIVVKKVIGVDP